MDVKFFHLFVTFPFLSAVSGISSQDSICNSAFSCGNITDLSYPFWSDTRPYYCGHKAFKLKNCEGNRVHPTLEIGALNYRVIGINSSSQTLRIARLDLSENICPDRFVNTTIDPSLFSYTPKDVNATLLYNCSSLPSNSYPNRFSCDEREGFMAVALRLAPICDARVEIPVLSEAVGGGGFNETVGVSEVLNRGFDVRWRVEEEFCRDCVLSGGICGYNTSLSQPQCVCPDRSTSVGFCGPETRSRRDTIPKIVIATGSAVLALLLVAFLKICHSRRRSCKRRLLFWQKRSVDEQNIQAFIKSLGFIATERWTYAQIKQMTNSFHNKLGQGGYGSVFKGKLPNGRAVAVKLLGTSRGSGEEFINEVASISRTSHVNIVSLVGFCFEGCKRALIYEFMPNGSLEKFIYNDNPPEPSQNLGWEKLYQIAVGIARGLEYLHQGCSTRILHFDIKPHNILLDEDFCPKISDFGLSKLSCRKQSMVSMMDARGTIGYIAPEVFSRNFGQVSHKSDVYSYGMMVLEMVGGRKNLNPKVDNTSEIYFPHWIYRRVELNEDLGLQGNGTKEESELARKMILVGLWCIQNDPSLRPGMSEVLEMLSGSLEAIKIPPKPFVSSSPPRPDPGSSSIVSISLQ